MKEKKMLIVCAVILPLLIIYLLFSFTKWDFNPETWSSEWRGVAAILGLFGSIVCTLIVIEDK